MLLDATRLLVFPALMAFAASSDLLTMTISNRVSLLLVAGFIVLALACGMSLHEVSWHFVAAFSVLIVTYGFFTQGWIGGGDAKLAAATALWLGFDNLLDYFTYASLLGGALTLGLLQLRKLPLPAVIARHAWVERLHDQESGVPYGIALSAAALLVYPHTSWLKTLAM
jgi:prepilin peptidase CpaA